MKYTNDGSQTMLLAGLCGILLLSSVLLLFSVVKRLRRWKQLAQTDPQIGCLNAAGLATAAEKYLAKEDGRYAVVTMQLCNYRQILQTFGANKTLRVLKYLYRVLETDLRNVEPAGSLGAGCFCFLLKNRQESAIKARLIRLQENVNQFNHKAGIPYSLKLRFGIVIPGEGNISWMEIRENTEQLLEETREDICFYREANVPDMARKWEQIRQMDRSLANGDFQAYLQPRVRLSDNRIVGAEALIRWRHPQRGMLTPNMFIPILEEYRLVARYDRFLFEQVCQHMAAWAKDGKDPCVVSVNLSAESYRQKDFPHTYIQITQKYGIAPELIEFELSKSLQQGDIDQLKGVVEAIRAENFHCSLDNFGGSEVPLHLLRELNVDTVKLDPAFFSGENNNRRNRFILEAIFKITSQLHIHTVATGIDNTTQVQYLKQAGCDMVQGFQYFHPLPAEEFCRAAYDGNGLRYVTDAEAPASAIPMVRNQAGNFVMFSLRTESDRIVFSRWFSPVLEGRLSHTGAMALLRHSELIHENDRKDFFHLLERCQKENGWVENAVRFYTAKDRYEWLEVHLHREYLPSADETVISGTLVNMTGLKNEVDRWKEKANRDTLTGLYNREYFEKFVSAAIEKNQLTNGAVVFVDIDDFKLVNDTLGHTVGDDVICWFAKRVLGAFRHTDIVARYGGDEFVVFVNGVGREEVRKCLQRLCDDFSSPYRNGDIEYFVSGSIGGAIFPDDGRTYLELLNRADSALYEAKRRGKNQFVLLSSGTEVPTKNKQ